MNKNLPALANQEKRVASVLHLHQIVMASASQMAVAAAKAGLEFKALKKDVGHGAWEPFFENQFSAHGITLRTAQRYMALADGLKSKVLKNDTAVSFLALLETAPSALSKKDQEKLTHVVAKSTDGATLSELYQDFGIVKKPQGSGARGGKREKRADDDGKVTPEVIAAGKVATTEALVGSLTEALMDKPWNAADEKLRKKLLGLLEDVKTAVKESL